MGVLMKKITIPLLIGLLAAGCVPLSLHPLYTEADLVFEPGLLGEWAERDSEETWTFTNGNENSYNFSYVDEEGKRGEFVAHLVNVQGNLFLDIRPKEPEEDAADIYRWHLLGMHSFLHVRQIHPELQMAVLDPDWLKDFLAKNPEEISYEAVDDKIILTARPKALQAFLIKCEGLEGAFGDYSNMTRKQESAGNAGQSAGQPTDAM
jgi:hypothetical protein